MCFVFGSDLKDSVLHLVPHHVPGYPRRFPHLYYFGGRSVGSILFVTSLESLWFFSPFHHRYLIAHYLFIFPFVFFFRGKATVYSFRFPSSGTSHIYIYIFKKSLTKQDKKIYTKKFLQLLCEFVSSPLSVHQSLESFISISCLLFFSAFCTIYNRLSSLFWFDFFVPLEASLRNLSFSVFQPVCPALQSTVPHLYSCKNRTPDGGRKSPYFTIFIQQLDKCRYTKKETCFILFFCLCVGIKLIKLILKSFLSFISNKSVYKST